MELHFPSYLFGLKNLRKTFAGKNHNNTRHFFLIVMHSFCIAVISYIFVNEIICIDSLTVCHLFSLSSNNNLNVNV